MKGILYMYLRVRLFALFLKDNLILKPKDLNSSPGY